MHVRACRVTLNGRAGYAEPLFSMLRAGFALAKGAVHSSLIDQSVCLSIYLSIY